MDSSSLNAPPGRPTPRSRLLLVALLILASRLPFLGAGYGADPDAWRLANSARYILETGRYGASRLPGHPVQEIACAWISPGGPWALNGATALLSVVAGLAFVVLLGRLGVPHPALSGLALAAIPVAYAHSTDSMDYVWALAFLLVALNAARGGRATLAGVLLGLAIGTRITYVVYLLPLALLFLWGSPEARRAVTRIRFALTALMVAALAYLPVYLEYGPGFLRTYETGYPRTLFFLKQLTLDVWGVLGLGALAYATLALAFRALRRSSPRSAPDPERRMWTIVCAVAILLTVGTYLLLPHDAGYIIPALPFALLLLGLWLPRQSYSFFCSLLLISPFVLELTEAERRTGPAPARVAIPLSISGWHLRLEPLRGPVPFDRARRISETEYTRSLLEQEAAASGRRIVVVHDWLPMIQSLAGGEAVGETRFVAYLSLADLREHLQQGGSVHYLPEADWPNEAVHGYNLHDHGAQLLDPARSTSEEGHER